MVATLSGRAGHDIVSNALAALRSLEHRGAAGSDAGSGDGAGIVTQLPDGFFRQVVGFELPRAGRYAAGTAFLPTDPGERQAVRDRLTALAGEEDLTVLGWRELPVHPDQIGVLARSV